MVAKRIHRFGIGLLAAAVLATGGVVAMPAPPASAADAYCMTAPTYMSKLRYGSTGPSVKYLQCILRDLGYYNVQVDGKFGPQTDKSVRHWQGTHRDSGPADGVVGEKTWRSLRTASKTY